MDPPDPFQSSIKLMLEKDHGEILSWKRRALRVQLHAMAYIQFNIRAYINYELPSLFPSRPILAGFRQGK